MDEKELFNNIKSLVKTEKNYISRNFQTIGGMWTVDTWKKDGVIFQLMDEGYTDRIFIDGILDVTMNHNGTITFYKGNAKDLEIIYNSINER